MVPRDFVQPDLSHTFEDATFMSALSDEEFEKMNKTFERVKNYSKKSSWARAILGFVAEFKNLPDPWWQSYSRHGPGH
eukprot:3283077-Amphidinium_carterae.1